MSTSDNGALGVPSDEPDAVCRGWWAQPDRAKDAALFMLADTAMGISLTDHATGEMSPPDWLNLGTVVHLDAIGEAKVGVLEVELGLSTGVVWSAGWTETFCDAVVRALQRVVESEAAATAAPTVPTHATTSPDLPPPPDLQPAAPVMPPPAPVSTGSTPVSTEAASPVMPPPLPVATESAPVSNELAPVMPPPTPVSAEPVAPSAPLPFAPLPPPLPSNLVPGSPVGEPDQLPVPGAAGTPPLAPPFAPVDAPSPDLAPTADAANSPAVQPHAELERSHPGADSGATLVLEDVVYLGGHPEESKKRKRCTATMTTLGVTVEGPSGMALSVPWTDVALVEAQNSDEARFRMNLRVHRDATAVVLSMHGDTKIMLEARDCPTIPLRTAITQLLVGQHVEVA